MKVCKATMLNVSKSACCKESPTGRVTQTSSHKSRSTRVNGSLELSPSRVNGNTNCMVNKKVNKNALKFPYKWKHAYLHRELPFISSSPFRTLPNLFNHNIFYEFILYKLVVAELTWVIYGRNQQVESESSHLGLLTRVESFFAFDSGRRKSRLESE
jgi:hypothetical protein